MTTTSGSFSGGIEQADAGELTDHAEVEKIVQRLRHSK